MEWQKIIWDILNLIPIFKLELSMRLFFYYVHIHNLWLRTHGPTEQTPIILFSIAVIQQWFKIFSCKKRYAICHQLLWHILSFGIHPKMVFVGFEHVNIGIFEKKNFDNYGFFLRIFTNNIFIIVARFYKLIDNLYNCT